MISHDRILTLCLVSLLAACTEPAGPREQGRVTIPSTHAVSRPMNASAASTDPSPVWTIVDAQSTNFISDGRGDYVTGACGLVGSIYYSNYDASTQTGGDATLDNTGNGSKKPLCARRSIRVTLNGVTRDVPFI